jgi:ubiquinone biosynthesis protein COQ9
MTQTQNQTRAMTLDEARDAMLDAALMHVPFDGWSEATFRAAARDADIPRAVADAACPRGAVDLALAFHEAGDREMLRRLNAEDLSTLRFRDKIATAVRFRIEAAQDREVVRRASSLFALPNYSADGARALWGTADKIWTALGDRSDDINWYTKRATLSGVYAATVLYWLGDESEGHAATWAFLDRRIGDVMQIEKARAQVRDNPVLKRVFAGPLWLAGQVKPPGPRTGPRLPGYLGRAPAGGKSSRLPG